MFLSVTRCRSSHSIHSEYCCPLSGRPWHASWNHASHFWHWIQFIPLLSSQNFCLRVWHGVVSCSVTCNGFDIHICFFPSFRHIFRFQQCSHNFFVGGCGSVVFNCFDFCISKFLKGVEVNTSACCFFGSCVLSEPFRRAVLETLWQTSEPNPPAGSPRQNVFIRNWF